MNDSTHRPDLKDTNSTQAEGLASAKRAALLVIDVQQGLCAGPYAAHDSVAVIARINGLLLRARAAQALVVLVQHEEAEGLVYGSAEWQLADGLAALPTDARVRKQASSAFHQTRLPTLLQAQGIERVLVCGLQSDYCVDSTVRSALEHHYAVTLVSDAHTTVDNGQLTAAQITAHHNRTLSNLGGYGVTVTACAAADVVF